MSISCCGNQYSITDIPHNQPHNQKDSQMGKQEEEASKKMQSIQNSMDYSLFNEYVESFKLEECDLHAYGFVKLRRDEFIKLRALNYERMSLSKKEVKKQVLPFMSFASGLAVFCNFPILGAGMLTTSLVMGSGLSISLGSGFVMISTACRLQEQDADDRAISKASIAQLKGGLRFCTACQKADQIRAQAKDRSRGFFNRLIFSGNKSLKGRVVSTTSEESWLPSLAVNPSWKERITKIEKELKGRGEEITMQSWEIDRLVDLFR